MDAEHAFDFTRVRETRLLKLLDVWNAARTNRHEMPQKSQIDIAALGEAKLLPNSWLVEVPETGEPFYRVVGDQIRTLFGTSMQQRPLSAIYTEDVAVMLEERWRGMLESRTFSHTAGLVYFDTHRSLEGERLAFPVSDETGSPRFILGATIYEISPTKPEEEGPLGFDQRLHTDVSIQSIDPP